MVWASLQDGSFEAEFSHGGQIPRVSTCSVVQPWETQRVTPIVLHSGKESQGHSVRRKGGKLPPLKGEVSENLQSCFKTLPSLLDRAVCNPPSSRTDSFPPKSSPNSFLPRGFRHSLTVKDLSLQPSPGVDETPQGGFPGDSSCCSEGLWGKEMCCLLCTLTIPR